MTVRFLTALAAMAVAGIGAASASDAGANEAGAIPARVAAPIVVAQGSGSSGLGSNQQSKARPNPAGDGTTEQYFTVEFSSRRVASLTRQQVAAAFGSKLASGNVEVPKGDFDAAVDNAVKQLANWNGKGSQSFCVPRVCWEVFVAP